MILTGGFSDKGRHSACEVLIKDLKIPKQVQNLPKALFVSSLVIHDATILLCGGHGNQKKCFQLDGGIWKEHSTLVEKRSFHSAVATQSATFIFGGIDSQTTYEYLSKDSTKWKRGKTEIPGVGFVHGCAIAVNSNQEIWLIGGLEACKRILVFNVNNYTFQVLSSQLIVGAIGRRCAYIPNTNKIMITGGFDNGDFLDSTEILDPEDGSVTKASPMNSRRINHGIGVITINGQNELVVFGGYDGRTRLGSVEFYNTETEKWEYTDITMNEPKESFAFLTVKRGDIICKV